LTASSTLDDDGADPTPVVESTIGVLVVADIRLHRDGLADTLRRQQAIRVLGAAADPENALTMARSLSPDVVLVDMVMPDAMRTVRALAQDVPEARILALAVPETEKEMIACVEAGATGCMMREASLEQVVSAVEGIARGESPCSPRMAAVVFERVRAVAPGGTEARLTPREEEIVGLIDEGLSNKQIAERLCIETPTVKNHIHSILEKLHVARRGEAAAAVRHRSGGERVSNCALAPILLYGMREPFELIISGPWN
jgi:two-component system nitrate/nitrite response regulator NarL